jgi:hypothetical protein
VCDKCIVIIFSLPNLYIFYLKIEMHCECVCARVRVYVRACVCLRVVVLEDVSEPTTCPMQKAARVIPRRRSGRSGRSTYKTQHAVTSHLNDVARFAKTNYKLQTKHN